MLTDSFAVVPSEADRTVTVVVYIIGNALIRVEARCTTLAVGSVRSYNIADVLIGQGNCGNEGSNIWTWMHSYFWGTRMHPVSLSQDIYNFHATAPGVSFWQTWRIINVHYYYYVYYKYFTTSINMHISSISWYTWRSYNATYIFLSSITDFLNHSTQICVYSEFFSVISTFHLHAD